MKIIFAAFVGVLLATSSIAATSSSESQQEQKSPKIERIGGDFVVGAIKKLKDGAFSVEFTAAEGEPKYKRLVLESMHVHAAIAEGAKLRLSADVVAISGATAEVSQVVLFLPGRVGRTPVWMLSRKVSPGAPPAKLIEMHAPSTDYQVM